MPMRENDTFRLSKAAKAAVIGEDRDVTLLPGIIVTVVLVLGSIDCPDAYEVEAFLSDEVIYALATIDARDVES